MKKVLSILFIAMFLLLKVANAQEEVLNNIQSKIELAVYKDNDIERVQSIVDSLTYLQQKSNNSLLSYWKAFASYNLAILYMQEKQDDNAKEAIEKGITTIDEIKRKTSDDYALLSILQGLDLTYMNFLEVPFNAKKAQGSSEESVKLDPNNLRAQLAEAINDFYTPKMFGGGKKVERILKKAIELKDTYDVNPYAPTWGKDLAYSYLIRFYEKKNDWERAQKYYDRSVEELGIKPIIEKFKPSKVKESK
ncbi:MAG: hypothetical protein ACEPOV_02080 [Hyphomicrobiales bacterium]